MTGLLMQMGIGWVPDDEPDAPPNGVRSANPGEYATEIFRLVDLLAGAKNLIAHIADKADANARDADRWRALLASQRIRVMGSAGFGYGDRAPDPHGYRHMGVEFWTKHHMGEGSPAVQEIVRREHAHALETLDQYIAAINELSTIPPETG